MKNITKNIINIIWYVVVFELVQLLTTYIVIISWLLFQGKDLHHALSTIQHQLLNNSTALIVAYALASLLVILIFAWRKWTPFKRTYLKSHPWATLFWVGLMVFGTIIPSIWLQEQLGLEMSEGIEKLLTQLLGNPFGYVAVGILAPLAEEVVFRGAVLRTLLKMLDENWYWIAILISALIFGGVHGNDAQFVHATLIGLLIGWMYYKTKSIVPGVVFHWVNNSIAYVLYNLMPNTQNATLVEIFKGNQTSVYLALGFSFCIFLPCLFQLFLRFKDKV